MVFYINILIGCFFVIFFSVMIEACVDSISNADVTRLSNSHLKIGNIWKKLLKNINHPVTVVIIVNTMAMFTCAGIIGKIVSELFDPVHFAIISSILCYVVIQWGIVLPRTLGNRFKIPIAFLVAFPLYVITIIFKPLLIVIEFVNKPFQKKRPFDNESMLVEIATLARSAALDEKISREQAHLIERSIHLSKMKASDIMVDCSEVNFLSDSMTLSEALIASHMHHHTRFPLTKAGNIDEITGYVNFKDIVGALRLNPSNPTLTGIKRPIETVRDNVLLSELLKKFTREYQHFAMVKDESGKTIGMVTLEDLIEALVGELEDEYDKPPELLVQLSENRFRAGGSITFDILKERVYNQLPGWDLSIDEWMLGLCAGNVPENYSVSYQNVSFRVRRISRGHIYDIIIDRPPVESGIQNLL